jgi:hypothetical protein
MAEAAPVMRARPPTAAIPKSASLFFIGSLLLDNATRTGSKRRRSVKVASRQKKRIKLVLRDAADERQEGGPPSMTMEVLLRQPPKPNDQRSLESLE